MLGGFRLFFNENLESLNTLLEMLNCSYNTQMVANLRESWEGLWEGKNERGCLPKPIELLIILWVQVMHLPNETCKKMQSGVGWALFQYVQGLAWAEIKQLWKDGLLAYITVPWNLADIFTIANFMGWIGRFFLPPDRRVIFLLSRIASSCLSPGTEGNLGRSQPRKDSDWKVCERENYLRWPDPDSEII